MTVEEAIEKLKPIQLRTEDNKVMFGLNIKDIEKIFPRENYNIIQNDKIDYEQLFCLLLIYCKNFKDKP